MGDFSMARAEASRLVGSYGNLPALNDALRLASEVAFLISPATSCPRLPPGCEVLITAVAIDPNEECYDVGGKRAIGRYGLLRLANAAGVAWNARASGRTDDRRDPYLVEWHAEGARPDLLGGWLPIVGDLQMDLRDESAQVRRIRETSRERLRDDGSVWKTAAQVADDQIRDTRAKILEHAQSKAKLRAIRETLAIPSFTWEDLAKRLFLVTRLEFVGDANNAEDRAAFRDRALGGALALFGPTLPRPRAQLPPATPAAAPHVLTAEFEEEPPPAARETRRAAPQAPPPQADDGIDRCDYCGSEDGVDELEAPEGLLISCCRRPDCRALARGDAERAGAGPKMDEAPRRGSSAPSGGMTAKFGRQKGAALHAMTEENLRWYEGKIRDSAGDPSRARYRDENERILVAIAAEWKRRSGSASSSHSHRDPTGVPIGGPVDVDDDDIPF